ncbi:tRNA-splicing endonuclease subunit Sen15-like [Saccostrea echinata]|uniref:tRNA-splicing endonuclease subunit Sen15-like n=1 Tax=Saccostrea echinata TaxID=191078 RepID=UPI002A81F016|nr:tRNA-splicing endonuclease subunit Sen15-like [Saccostrea echinata]
MEESSTPYDHAKFKELESFGLKNLVQIRTTFNVYLDLCEVRGWWNVKLHGRKDLDLAFISGHPTREEPREIILPLLSSDSISTHCLQQYLKEIKVDGYETHGITLAICDADTTTVYYKIAEGLVTPEPPEVTEVKKVQRFELMRKRQLNTQRAIQTYKTAKLNDSTPQEGEGVITEERSSMT